MKQSVNYPAAGYADLWPLRILVTIILFLALIAIPAYSEYLKRNKLIPVLDALQLAVEERYRETRQLADIEKIAVIAGHEEVDVKEGQIRINLSLIDGDIADQYLQLQPFSENETIAWKCTFVGDVYKDDIPELGDNICSESHLALKERAFAEQIWKFFKEMSNILLGYVLFIGFTFLVG